MRTGTEIKIRLSLIRHGATKSNQEHRYLGRADEALAEEGIKYLIQKKESGKLPSPECVFTGPMLRCRQTAEILFPKVKKCVISDWTEMDFGLFEGKNYEELAGNAFYQKWIDSGGVLPFPEGESREAFVKRTMGGFDKMISLLREQGGLTDNREIAAVVHGGTIMALCSSLFGGDYFDYQAGCGEGFRVRLLSGIKAFAERGAVVYAKDGLRLQEIEKI